MSGHSRTIREQTAETFDNADFIILSESAGRIPQKEAESKLEIVWKQACKLSLWDRFLSELFPSAFGKMTR
jgi:hypothetical protein